MTGALLTCSGPPEFRVYPNRVAMGRAAAADVAVELRQRLAAQPLVRMVFAAAPSQQDMLDALASEPGIDWGRVTAFHMDEYLVCRRTHRSASVAGCAGRSSTVCRSARSTCSSPDGIAEACSHDYAALLAAGADRHRLPRHRGERPPRVQRSAGRRSCRSTDVKIVALDDGLPAAAGGRRCVRDFGEVPAHAVTLTIPRLLAADRLFCVVPGLAKREAVRRTLRDPIGRRLPGDGACAPTHAALLYLDRESASVSPKPSSIDLRF